MITFIKYPLTDIGLKVFKCDKFFEASKVVSHKGFIVAYPQFEIIENKIVYPKENKIGFYCKSLSWKDILKFKGGFNIEKCPQKEWQYIGRKWYFETNQKLPRNIKKKIIGKIK